MDAGKHVFCEKPLADTVEKCKEAEQIVAAHPDLIFMLGFMRRYDHSYAVAKKKIDNGDIGDIILVRCYSQDPISIIEGTLEYAPRSGGQFIDMSIHDIDLIRWLTNSEPRNLWAVGGCYEFKQYKDWDDGDNVSCLMQCENDAMAFFFAGRAAAHGSHVETEIVGTRGTLRIANVPADSMVEVMSQHGVCRECYYLSSGVLSMPKGVPNKRYTPEFKKKVVETMMEEKLSYREVTRQSEISDHNIVKAWERIYLTEGPGGLGD